MSPNPTMKLELLLSEVRAARRHGPSGRVASVLSSDQDEVTMWDATPLIRELQPELSLHAERVSERGHSQYHRLHYVLIRSTGDVVKVTESALNCWLKDNTKGGGEMQVESAILSIRKSEELKSLTQGSRNKVTKYLTWLESEFKKANG
jgi:hypothetical protein